MIDLVAECPVIDGITRVATGIDSRCIQVIAVIQYEFSASQNGVHLLLCKHLRLIIAFTDFLFDITNIGSQMFF